MTACPHDPLRWFRCRSAEAFKLTHVYLDGMGVALIDNLELFNKITHLYLQRNLLTELKNLDYQVQ